MILLRLFLTFLTIGMVSFGGGYAMLPLFERMIVEQHGWLTRTLFVDMIALSQITPGPIAINSATFIGYQVARTINPFIGVMGSAVSTVGVIFVPVFLVGFVSKHSEGFKTSRKIQAVFTGLRPALVGLIFSSVASIAADAYHDLASAGIFAVLLFLLWKVKLHPIFVIVISALLGLFIYG